MADRSFTASLLEVLRRRWLPGAAVFLLVLGAATAVVFLSPPIHRAEARLRLGEPPPAQGVSSGGFLSLLRLGGDPFANDVELIGSRTLTEGVILDAGLNASIVRPRRVDRDSVFTRLSVSEQTEKALFDLRWRDDGGVEVRQVSPVDSAVATGRVGTALRFGGLTVVARAREGDMPEEVRLRTAPYGDAIRVFRPRIVVERTRREANVLEISFDHAEPQVALAAVSAAVSRFVELRTILQARESSQNMDSLRVVAVQTALELTAAEDDLEAFQEQARIVAPDAQSAALITRYAEVSADLERARVELVAVDALLTRVATSAERSVAWANLVAFPPFMANGTVSGLLAQLTTLEQQRRGLASRRVSESRELRLVEEQIDFIDGTLRSMAESYRAAIDESIRPLEEQLNGLDALLAEAPSSLVSLGRKQRDIRLLSQVLLLTEQRIRQEELREALTFGNIQVIDPPALRFKPVWPRKKLGLAVGLLLAGLFSVMAMLVQEQADGALRRASELQLITAAPILGTFVRSSGSRVAPTEAEWRLLARAWRGREAESSEVVLVPVGGESLGREAARGLAERPSGDPLEPTVDTFVPTFRVAPDLSHFAVAAEAIDPAKPVILVVVCGRTPGYEVARAVRLIGELGGRVTGSILICRSEADAKAAWL